MIKVFLSNVSIAHSIRASHSNRRSRFFLVFSHVLFGFVFFSGLVRLCAAQAALSSIQEIKALSIAEAEKQIPVQFRGIVTTVMDAKSVVMVHDNHGRGVYCVRAGKNHSNLKLGQEVEVTGRTGAGGFAPVVLEAQCKITETRNLPIAESVDLNPAAMMQQDGMWRQVQGIVHSVMSQSIGPDSGITIIIAVEGRTFRVQVLDEMPSSLPEDLVDAKITVTGVCLPLYNERRQMTGIYLLAPSLAQLKIETPPVTPVAAPLYPVGKILQFQPDILSGHRVRVRGTVTYVAPHTVLYLADSTGSMRIRGAGIGSTVTVGDMVEVIGFPTMGEYSPSLDDISVVSRQGGGMIPKPRPTTAEAILGGIHDAELVEVNGRLLDIRSSPEHVLLRLAGESETFHAKLSKTEASADWISSLPIDSVIRVVGICSLSDGSFEVALRHSTDVQMIRPPPWWTLHRLRWALITVTALFICTAVAIAWHSRRKINQQILARREAEAQFKATNLERNRIAAELHDTLEQGLTGISSQLHVALKLFEKRPQESRKYLELAKTLVRSSQEEVRRSIWNLRSQLLENNDLIGALHTVGFQLCHSADLRFSIETEGVRCRLSEFAENNLLRVGQEAITNAVKHARASHIIVRFAFQADSVSMSVTDDGRGFEIIDASASSPGHFGLVGMKERIKKLGGSFAVRSCPGCTSVNIQVPFSRSGQSSNDS